MPRKRLDDRTADRLLRGEARPDKVPAELADVAELIRQAATPGPTGPSAVEAPTVSAMRAELFSGAPPLYVPATIGAARTGAGRSGRARSTAAKVGGLAAALALLGGGTAAAATGSLPSPAQHAASSVLAKVGVSVPNGHGKGHGYGLTGNKGKDGSSDSSDTDTSDNNGGNGSNGKSNGPSSNATFGLCNAESHNAGHTNSSVFPPASTCDTVVHPGQGTPPADPGSQGQANGGGQANKPSDPGSQGQANKPSDPGSQGQGAGQGAGQNNGANPNGAASTTTTTTGGGTTTTTSGGGNGGNGNGGTGSNGGGNNGHTNSTPTTTAHS